MKNGIKTKASRPVDKAEKFLNRLTLSAPHASGKNDIPEIDVHGVNSKMQNRELLNLEEIESDRQRLHQELKEYKLEMAEINNELVHAKEQAEITADKYSELYDFAPSGYLTLSEDGDILEINLCGSLMIGKERSILNKSRFGFFISDASKPAFNHFLKNIFGNSTKSICEVTLSDSCKAPLDLHLTGNAFGDRKQCLVTMIDITDRKRTEKELALIKQRLELAQQAAGAGAWDWDMTCQQLIWSKELFIIFGLDPQKTEATFDTWNQVLHPADRAIAAKRLEHAIKERIQLNSEYRILLPGGKVRWISALGNTTYSQKGEPLRMSGICTDITERKMAEEALRESEEQFRNLFTNSLDGVAIHQIVLDDQGNPVDYIFLRANPAFEAQTGLNIESILGKRVTEVIPGIEKTPLIGIYGNVALGGEPVTFERFFEPLNKYFHITVYRVEQGRFVTVFKDITERRLADEKLRASEHNLAEAERIGNTGSWEYDVATDTAAWSANMFRIFDVDPATPKELVFKYFIENLVHPDDRASVLSVFRDALAGKRPYDLEYRVVKLDKSVRNVHVVAKILCDEKGNPLRMIGRAEDITESKQIEHAQNFLLQCGYPGSGEDFFESLARYISTSLDMEYVCIDRLEGDGLTAQTVAVFNDGSLETNVSYALKETPCGDLVGKHICCFPAGVCGLFPRDAALRDLKAESYIGTTLWGFDGKPIGLIAVIGQKPLKNKVLAESLLKMVSMRAAGELERMKAAEEINKLNAELEHRVKQRTLQLENSNKELEAFSYSVSHDLRAPLRGIDGWSLALLEEYNYQLDDQGRLYLSRVRNEAQRMGFLIDDLLKLSRVTRDEIHPVNLDLSAIALAIAERLTEALPERQFEFIIEPGLAISGDYAMLEIALTNLLDNACKFTALQTVARIEFGKTEKDGQQVFFIRDNGVGFNMEYATKLFGSFQRMHKQSDFPGTGIGLAIVRRIIFRHGGHIWAESKPNEGASFYFTVLKY